MYQHGSQKHNQSRVPFISLSLIIRHFCANNSYTLMFVEQHPLMLHPTARFDPFNSLPGSIAANLKKHASEAFLLWCDQKKAVAVWKLIVCAFLG